MDLESWLQENKFDRYAERWGYKKWATFLRNLSTHVLWNPAVQNHISYEGHHFFSKWSKLNLNFENAKKSWEKVFRFSHNCIWRCCNNLSLLRRQYLSWIANVLTNSPNILHITKRDFFQLNCLHSDKWIW